jgi:hypothetical protein
LTKANAGTTAWASARQAMRSTTTASTATTIRRTRPPQSKSRQLSLHHDASNAWSALERRCARARSRHVSIDIRGPVSVAREIDSTRLPEPLPGASLLRNDRMTVGAITEQISHETPKRPSARPSARRRGTSGLIIESARNVRRWMAGARQRQGPGASGGQTQ